MSQILTPRDRVVYWTKKHSSAGRGTVHVNSEFLFALAFVQTVKANMIPRRCAAYACP